MDFLNGIAFKLPVFDESLLSQRGNIFRVKPFQLLKSVKNKKWECFTCVFISVIVGMIAVFLVRRFDSKLPSMVWIPPGTFLMGPSPAESGEPAKKSQHSVTLTKGFYMSKYLVTQEEFFSLMGKNPSVFRGKTNLPVECVTWFEATNYCRMLTDKEREAGHIKTGWSYRLPTEAEWEYACRAGTTTAFYFGDSIQGGMANFDSRYEYSIQGGTVHKKYPVGWGFCTTPVGSYPQNPWGLYDMCGNVWEWCLDLYEEYPMGAVTNPMGGTTGTNRVLRGGSFGNQGVHVRSAIRCQWAPDFTNYNPGFRIALSEDLKKN